MALRLFSRRTQCFAALSKILPQCPDRCSPQIILSLSLGIQVPVVCGCLWCAQNPWWHSWLLCLKHCGEKQASEVAFCRRAGRSLSHYSHGSKMEQQRTKQHTWCFHQRWDRSIGQQYTGELSATMVSDMTPSKRNHMTTFSSCRLAAKAGLESASQGTSSDRRVSLHAPGHAPAKVEPPYQPAAPSPRYQSWLVRCMSDAAMLSSLW